MSDGTQRYLMWCDLIPKYVDMGSAARKKAKRAFAENCGKSLSSEVHTYKEIHNLYTTDNTATLQYVNVPSINQFGQLEFTKLDAQEQGKETMCYETTNPVDASLSYIKDRARSHYYSSEHDIENKFSYPHPKSMKEARSWLKDGNWHVEEPTDNDEDRFFSVWDIFHWGKDPLDLKARDKAFKDLNSDFETVKDVVSIITDEDRRLKALQDFLSKSYV